MFKRIPLAVDVEEWAISPFLSPRFLFCCISRFPLLLVTLSSTVKDGLTESWDIWLSSILRVVSWVGSPQATVPMVHLIDRGSRAC